MYLSDACNAVKLLLNGHGITIKQSNRRPERQMHHELLIYSSYRELSDSHATRLRLVSYFTRCDVSCDPLQYTHTRKNVIYLLIIQ